MNAYLRHFYLYKQASSQESAQAAALQHFGLYRVKTAFTLLANKTPRWRADNEAEILRDNTEREYDQSHRLEQVGRYLARTGTMMGSINAGVRGYEGRPLRDVVPSVVFSTLSGALGGGLSGQRDKQVAELAKQKIEGLGITDPLERRMLEQRLRPGIAGDAVGGAVLGGLGSLGLSSLAAIAGNNIHYETRGGRAGAHEREAAREAARAPAQDQQAWDGFHGDNPPGY